MAEPTISNLTDALSAPLGDLIAAVGRGVAEAQRALDMHTFATFKEIYGDESDAYEEFRKLGYRPSFFVLPETTAEIIVSLTVGGVSAAQGIETSSQSNVRLIAAPIDASYRNRFDYNMAAASKLTFKIVPVPPTPQVENMRIMPSVVNKLLGEVRAILAPLDVRLQVIDNATKQETTEPLSNAKVTAVTPAAGTILSPRQTVRITVEKVA